MCGPLDVGCHTQEALGSAADKFYEVVANGLRSGLEYVSTFWLEVPSPTLAQGSGQSWTGAPAITEMQGFLMPLTAAFAVVSFSVALLQIALSPERAGEGLKGVLRQLAVVVLGTVPALAATQLMMQAGDEFSPWVVEQAAGGDASTVLAAGMIPAATPGAELGLFLFLFIFALVGSIVQCVFMVVRAAAILVLFVMLPLMAAGAATEEGWLRLKRLWALILGFVLYKPVAAIIFAVGLRLMSDEQSGGDEVQNALYGLTVILMAALALPAFIKFVMPLAAAGSSSAFSGGAALGAVAGGAAVVGLAGTGGAGAAMGAGQAVGRGAAGAGAGTAEGAGGGDLAGAGAGGGASSVSGVRGTGAGTGGGAGVGADAGAGGSDGLDEPDASASGQGAVGDGALGRRGSGRGGGEAGGAAGGAAGAAGAAGGASGGDGRSGAESAGGRGGGVSGAEASVPASAPASDAGGGSGSPGGAVSNAPVASGDEGRSAGTSRRREGVERVAGDVARRIGRAGDEAAEGAE